MSCTDHAKMLEGVLVSRCHCQSSRQEDRQLVTYKIADILSASYCPPEILSNQHDSCEVKRGEENKGTLA
eukprot:scaffold158799_cov24-Tisochrysis_lutea.AAC.2